MLKDIIKNRYSARTFLDTEIEQDKIDYILECATHAPSKQGIYPYKIFVLGNSNKAQEIKEWLFWENTWCVDGQRAIPEGKESNNKRFNGQYKAPLVLVYVAHPPKSVENHVYADYMKDFLKHSTDKVNTDATVSASFAMLAAEEQGLRTCFGKCHDEKLVAEKLGMPSKAVIVVGMGYAEDYKGDVEYMGQEVYKDGVIQGYQPKNLPQDALVPDHYDRQRKPSNIIVKV